MIMRIYALFTNQLFVYKSNQENEFRSLFELNRLNEINEEVHHIMILKMS